MSIITRLKRERKYFKNNFSLLVLALPACVSLFIFAYLPMVGIVLAFKNYKTSKGFWGSAWAGLDNFKFFFASQDAFRVTKNTLLLNFLFISIGLIISVSLALMLFQLSKKATRIYQTAMFFPYFLSWVVVGYIVFSFLNGDHGVVNVLLRKMGIEAISWYSEPRYWTGIMIFAYLWKSVGYFSVIYYAGLMGIDPSYYEAAATDGATPFQQVRLISIPMLTPIIIVLVLLQIGRIFYADFGMFYFLPQNSGALYSVTDVIDTYVYRSLRVVGNIGMASAVGLYQSVVGLVLVLISNMIVRKINRESAIF